MGSSPLLEAPLDTVPLDLSDNKMLRESVEQECLAGMRKPARAVGILARASMVGARIAWEVTQFCRQYLFILDVGCSCVSPGYVIEGPA
eukprot:1779768-Amphidinium_carterae.2